MIQYSQVHKYTYKNISELPQTIVGCGIVGAGKTVTTDVEVHNQNLKLIKTKANKGNK